MARDVDQWLAGAVRLLLKRVAALEGKLEEQNSGHLSSSLDPHAADVVPGNPVGCEARITLCLEDLVPVVPEVLVAPPPLSQLNPRAVGFVPCLGKGCDQDVGDTAVDRLLDELDGSRHAQFGEWLPLDGAPALGGHQATEHAAAEHVEDAEDELTACIVDDIPSEQLLEWMCEDRVDEEEDCDEFELDGQECGSGAGLEPFTGSPTATGAGVPSAPPDLALTTLDGPAYPATCFADGTPLHHLLGWMGDGAEHDENEDEKYGDNLLSPVWLLGLEEWAGVRAASRKHVRIGDYMMGILAGDDEGENVGRDDC